MNHQIVLNQNENNWSEENKTLLLGFLEYVFEYLVIKAPVTIKLEPYAKDANDGINVAVNLRSAYVELNSRLIIIYCQNRGFLDILRSIAHELIHVQQLDLGQLTIDTEISFYLPDSSAPGYEFEYEAYGLSGIIVRNFRAILNEKE